MLRKVVLFYGILGIVVLEVTVVAASVGLALAASQAIESTVRRLPTTTYVASIIGLWGFFFELALLVGLIALGIVVPIAFWRNVVRRRKTVRREEPAEPRLLEGEVRLDAEVKRGA